MDQTYQFDREKFKDAVHFIVHYVESTHGTAALGNTKLHKILYYSDFLTYLKTMRPLTGEEFLRQKFGPTSKHLGTTLKQLAHDGRLKTSKSDYFGYAKSDYHSLLPPQIEKFSDPELELMRGMADFVCTHTATEISEFSHDDVWSSVTMGHVIPYFASFAMFPAIIEPEDIEDAAAELDQIAPDIEAKSRELGIF